nr:PREDICTED: midasin [Lepisosteus oculatus]
MENLELSLSSLGIISKHVEKSSSDFGTYLAKQVWSRQDRQCILGCLAQLLLDKEYTLLIGRHLRPLVLELLERNAEKIKADGRINHDLHERLCVALGKLLHISPDALPFALRYFEEAPPVFQRLFFTSAESGAVSYGPKRMKLRDLMGATLKFLKSDCAKFRELWNWSVCVSQLRTSDVMVKWYTAHCLAMVHEYTLLSLEEEQLQNVEKALMLANPGTPPTHQGGIARDRVGPDDLSQNVVAVCGVLLPRRALGSREQGRAKDIVLVDSTCQSLQRLAMAVASQKAVLLEGPIGCGKTALVEYLAEVTGHLKPPEILKVQLGDQTDSKMLLGMYRCTDVPGKFVWQPGTLTQAVASGHWILLEDIDHAPLDVISVLIPLMENKKLVIPGRGDCIEVAPGFQFFATRRLLSSGGGLYRPQNSHAALLDKHWARIQLTSMSQEELKEVMLKRYPNLSIVIDRLLDIFCQLTGDKRESENFSSCSKGSHPTVDMFPTKMEDRGAGLEGRGLSLRDLLKWCERIANNFDSTSSSTALNVFQEALDCFAAMLSNPERRQRTAEIIGSKLNISKEKAEHFCKMYKPAIRLSEMEVAVGRAAVARKQNEAIRLYVEKQTFAATRPSSVLLEQLSVCVNKGEPILLVGETGTGKTSTVQYLAGITGHRLRVVNMNQQSDTADLLGGYKPVDHKLILLPLREAFEDLFSQTFSRKQNLTFLGHVNTCFKAKRWPDLLKLMNHVCRSAISKEVSKKENAVLLKEQWEALALRLSQAQQQIKVSESALVFAFVEGTLAQAVKKGEWILLDEINLAAAETLECLSGLLEGTAGSLVLLDRGDTAGFTELYVEELENETDLRVLVSDYLKGLNVNKTTLGGIISFYLAVRKEANSRLVDGTGHRPHYSLRTLCRALKYAASNPCHSVQRSLYEGFCLSFLTQLDRASHPLVQKLICQHVLGGNTKCLKQPIPEPPKKNCVQVEGYWISKGDMELVIDSSYTLTPTVKLNLRDLARVVSAGTHPVLIQGETSVGKTSLIKWLAASTGNQCVRINNIAETQEVVKAHPRFMLFATQNPPGLYGGRKVLSRAFRNRFVELHFDELPSAELEIILHKRCSLPPSYCIRMVKVMLELQSHRRGSTVFAGKYGFITLRDLFRWAERYRLEDQTESSYDWLQHLANDGFMLLAGRVRKPEEAKTIQAILEKHFKKKVNPEALFSEEGVARQFGNGAPNVAELPEEFRHVVWTRGMRRLAVLAGRALRFGEPVLLVGDTGCGKTTICQLFAALAGQKFFSVNCHLHMETSDFLGGLRPVRHTSKEEGDGEGTRLFEWHDGPLVLAMKEDGVFLLDEISLADDSVLERLNSVLETEKTLVLAEKGSGDNDDVELITAGKKFRLLATMNPGGDFGKKELSPALRNRFTEIWCPQSNSRSDLVQIIQHNLRSGLSLDHINHQGRDIAELMLDFIDWLTRQEFARRCILSVRDVLSWVNFMNLVSEKTGAQPRLTDADWDLKVDPVTAFVHAACLVYIDGIGSGTTSPAAESAFVVRRACLDFLHKKLLKSVSLNEERISALQIYETTSARKPTWGENCFGIHPFYIAKGPLRDAGSPADYALAAGTTAVNAQRVLRALKLSRPVLLEGSPGVGKTSLVAALAKASGNHLIRINLSEQTDVTDLFGTDLPVEGGKGGEFAWRDGPLLAALKAGHWIVLDELNLASQSVLEGLNACFDHRAEIFVPELGMSFQVQHERTKIFGCQNPFAQGGGRKGLPKSFLNRFTQVYVDHLSDEDMELIGQFVFSAIDHHIISKIVQFSSQLVREVSVERKWGQRGGPWEFNLRDLSRWCQLMQADQSPGFWDPGKHVGLVYADRMRTEADRAQVLSVFRNVFGEDYVPYTGSLQFHLTPLSLQVGHSVLSRGGGGGGGGSSLRQELPLSILHQALRPLESLMKCVEVGWMAILVGPAGSGKTSLVHLLSLLAGHKLRVMAMNSAMDTTELLGGFEQVDLMRPWQQLLESVDYVVAVVTRRGLLSLDEAVPDTEHLLKKWSDFRKAQKKDQQRSGVSTEALNELEAIISLLQKLNTKLKVFTDMSKLVPSFLQFKEKHRQVVGGHLHGTFEWIDGMLIQALQAGDWLLMDNVNFCSPSVLDRLNALLEPGGALSVGERGVIDGTTPTITPHPNFRLFLTMDPVHGEISRAMRNRGVEIYIPGESEGAPWDPQDLKTVLHAAGVTGDCTCNLLSAVHVEIKDTILGSPASSVSSLLHAAALLNSQLQRGRSLPSALQQACREVYSLSQRSPSSQKQAAAIIEKHVSTMASDASWGDGLLCAGVWPDGISSAVQAAEDSCFSTVRRDGQVLSFCLSTLSLAGKRTCPLSLSDMRRALQGGSLEGQVFVGGGEADPEGEALRRLPAAVRLVTERASHGDCLLRASWLSHLSRSHKHAPDLVHIQLEAGVKALKAAFSSKLSEEGKHLIGLLQSHAKDDSRVLLDMRWNKQYLDILTTSFNFGSQESYMEYLEFLNSVTNRMILLMDREEQAHKEQVLLGCLAAKKSAPNSALRLSTAFCKGRVDFGHLPHPVLAHLRSFFDRWDACVLQCVRASQDTLLADDVMFEVLGLLQWRDRFWAVSSSVAADPQGIALLSLHWQWVQKHLVDKLPRLLVGPNKYECEQEVQSVSTNIQKLLSSPTCVYSAVKGIQKVLGKPLPFKAESVAECASQLRVLSSLLDVCRLRPERTGSQWSQEIRRLEEAAMGLSTKKGLLEAWGLVLQSNHRPEPHCTEISEVLRSSVELRQSEMTSTGLIVSHSSQKQDGGVGDPRPASEASLRQLCRRTQLWPLLEHLAVLSQYRLTADLLDLSAPQGESNLAVPLKNHLSQHINFCLHSTPMNVKQLQGLWFLLNSDKPAEELQFLRCELLSEALAVFWSSAVTSDPEHWLAWDPLTSKEEQKPPPTLLSTADKGPGLMSRAVWSKCLFEILTSCETAARWEPTGTEVLSCSRVTLGEWKERTRQLQDIGTLLWTNMASASVADFRTTDCRLQGLVLQRQLQALAGLLSPDLQEGFLQSCKGLAETGDAAAVDAVQSVLGAAFPSDLLPEGFVATVTTCLQQFGQGRLSDGELPPLARSAVFWVNMGLLQVQVWTPQTIFDPAVKRAYKLTYAQEELRSLQEEWRARSLSAQLLSGSSLGEKDISHSYHHPRIRFLWSRMRQLEDQIAQLSRKQACRPKEPLYKRLFQDVQHYVGSIAQPARVQGLLSRLLRALRPPRPGAGVRGLLNEEAAWQSSQQHFVRKLGEEYALYPDVLGPLRAAVLQMQHGMRLLASELSASLAPLPGLPKLVSCLSASPSLSAGLPSYLARADYLCSRPCLDALRGLEKLLPPQDSRRLIPGPSALLANALLYLQCHTLSQGLMEEDTVGLFRHVCQAVVNEWDEQERRAREREREEASLYRARSHGPGAGEEEQEERAFRRSFPQYGKDFADITSEPSLEQDAAMAEEENTESELADSGSVSQSCMNMVVQVHQQLCLGFSRSLWYQPHLPASYEKDLLRALVSSYQIAAPLITRFYHLIGSDVNAQLMGSHLLLGSLLLNAVRGGGQPDLQLESRGPYDFYQHPNTAEARQCLPVLEGLGQAVKQRLEDWPEHPALVQLLVVMERILGFSLSSPLAKFLNGLEILLAKAQDWESNASRSVSLRKELEAVTRLVIQWRRLELNCWSSSLDNALKRHAEKSTQRWFSIYQLVEKHLQDHRQGGMADGDAEGASSLSSVSTTLQAFIEGASLGEFHTRLDMLLAFHCHVLLAPQQEEKESLCSLLWNLYNYYKQFSESVQTKISELRHPIEKELKDFVKISRWNDVSFWSIKQSVEKTHRTLFKFVKKFEAALSGPCCPALTEQGSSADLDCVDSQSEDTPIHRLHRALQRVIPGRGKISKAEVPQEGPTPLDPSSLQVRLPFLTGKMKKMCVNLVKKSPLPELTEELDQFTAEVITSVHELQKLTVTPSAEKEKQKSEVKHILQHKQRALSDLFKMLAQIGLSYRKGVTWRRVADPVETLCLEPLDLRSALSVVKAADKQESTLLAEMTAAWEGCQKYFYRSQARLAALHTALQTPAKELGLGSVERCKGFSAHLLKLLIRQRKRLARLTQNWVHLRKLLSCIQEIQSGTSQPVGADCVLPPQEPLLQWTRRSQALAAQCVLVLEQLSLTLRCCPEEKPSALALAEGAQVIEAPAGRGSPEIDPAVGCPSPLAADSLPAGCRMRRADPAWTELTARVTRMLAETKALKAKLDELNPWPTEGKLQSWSHFSACCSGLSQLGGVAAQLLPVEKLFNPAPAAQTANQAQPALSQSLQYLRLEVENSLTEFTSWKTQLLTLGSTESDFPNTFPVDFSEQLENGISSVLCAVQSLVKRRQESDDGKGQQRDEASHENEKEQGEDLLKAGHLTKLLEDELSMDVASLSLQKVTGSVEQLLEMLRSHRDLCSSHQYREVAGAMGSLLRVQPMLAVYSELVRHYLAVSLGAHRSTGKLLAVLASVFTSLALKGFCLPQELMDDGSGEGAPQFHDYEGGGIGEGEGAKDISDKIENEEQVEDTFQEGQEKKEEDQDRADIKEEDNAIEMSEDFDGKLHDGDRKEPGEEEEEESEGEDEEDLDKKMGDLGEGEADKLDERLWGDEDDDDEDQDGSDKEEEFGQGMDEGQSELVAKDDNMDAGQDKDDKKKQEKEEEEQADNKEGKEKIHEQLDEREYDENEVDPYHGQQDKQPDTEAMNLPEELNLDQEEDEKPGEEQEQGEEDNPFDIEEKPMELEEKEGAVEEQEGEEPQEAQGEEPQKEAEEDMEEGEKKEEDQEPEREAAAEPDEEHVGEEEKEKESDAGQEDEKGDPAAQGQQPKGEEEEAAKEDEEQDLPESAERKEHDADGQTGEENVQSDTAVELAGAASERDQAKEEHGSGAADASQSEGHESKLMARVSSIKQSRSKTESFKRKPGRADNERSTGDRNERVHKRLRTVEASAEREEKSAPPEGQEEADVYEHIRQGEQAYDAQTYDVASTEQQKAEGASQEPEQEEDDVAMETEQEEEHLQEVNAQELKPEQNRSTSTRPQGVESGELENQPLGDEDEEETMKTEDSQEDKSEVLPDRSSESTVHTVPELLEDQLQTEVRDPEELRKQLEQQLDAWQKLPPGTQDEERAAAEMWQQYQALTSPLSQQLCEQLRLILEPTRAAKLKGDFRTGKRLNMRKVIPYIASQFRKDKIWLRRTKPSKREYQICLAIDDSSSMIDNHTKQLAFESLSVIGNALTLLEVGQVSVCSFGETVQLLHPFHEQFSDQSGARILRLCKFEQKKTRIAQFLETSANMFVSARQQSQNSSNSETAQLLLIVSDGRGLFLEGKERVMAAVQAARTANVFVIFVVLDNPNSRDSVLDIKVPIFKGPGEMPEIRSYMEEFPFPFYIILRDVNALPETLSDALRQWFELVTTTDQ